MDNGKLSNKAGVTLTGIWKIQDEKIINANDRRIGIGVANDARKQIPHTMEGSPVHLNQHLLPNGPGQKWIKSNVDGVYFNLRNPNSGKFLSAYPTPCKQSWRCGQSYRSIKIGIKGMYILKTQHAEMESNKKSTSRQKATMA